jgi:gp088|nr:MAG TPA: replicative DNA helicase [Caudoviricetes sp.]
MAKNKFIELLQRNFGEKDLVNFGVNKKFYLERKAKEDPEFEDRFSRDFEQAKHYVKNIGSQVKALRDKYDLYLSFTPTGGLERKKPNAQDTYIIAQDIDGAPIPTDLPPSYYWETSPNKYQGVWVLDNKVNPQEHEILCRKLVKKYGFDPCGVDIVHLYRIPGTVNHKYATDFKVSGMMGEGTVYRKRDFVKHLEDVEIRKSSIVSDEEIETINADLDNILDEYNAMSEFTHEMAIDRSEWAWKLENKLISNGASKEVVKFVLLNAPESKAKFTEATVDAEVNRAFAKYEAREEDKDGDEVEPIKRLSKKFKLEEVEAKSLKTVSDKGKTFKSKFNIVRVDEIEEFDPTDFWLIEDFWENGSVGIIGAPSKSFKSTFALNLACAVATGKPFDGREVKQGAVLIIQGENNLSMEQHKIYAITGSTTPPPIYFVEDNITMEHIHKLENDMRELEIKLLIIDPMYLLFGNGDINRHQDIVSRLETLSRISKNIGCAIMLIHHSRKLERGAKIQTADMYGSAFIEGWYESMILLQRKSNNSSTMTTYFRNHKSGDVYDLVVDDNMGCKVYARKGESAYDEPALDFSVLGEDSDE